MPYVNKGVRESLDQGRKPLVPGELNYVISQIVRSYLAMRGESYTIFNDIAGVLVCLQMELYRRKTALYEDQKMSESGDVF